MARRGYAVGSAVLEAVLPEHAGPTARVPVELGDRGLDTLDGIEAKSVVVEQLGAALEIIRRHHPPRIVTLGGDCSVSVAPFSELAARYGDDLAVLWVDSHPDVGTPASAYPGYHAMAVAALTGHGDPDVLALLPATVAPERIALAGVHVWEEDDYPNIADWGIRSFSPDDLRHSSRPLLDWLTVTGCTRVAILFDVDTVDSTEIVLGLGAEPDGLRAAEVHRVTTVDPARAASPSPSLEELSDVQPTPDPKSHDGQRPCSTDRTVSQIRWRTTVATSPNGGHGIGQAGRWASRSGKLI